MRHSDSRTTLQTSSHIIGDGHRRAVFSLAQSVLGNMSTLLANQAKMIAKGAPRVIHNDEILENVETDSVSKCPKRVIAILLYLGHRISPAADEFRIESVVLPNRRLPAREFVDSLDDKAAARVDAFSERLRLYGNRMQGKFVKSSRMTFSS